MTAIREALEAAGIPFERPIPSKTYDCLKPRFFHNTSGNPRRFDDTHKWCSRCEQWLTHDWFTKDASTASGLSAYCRPCRQQYWRNWNAKGSA